MRRNCVTTIAALLTVFAVAMLAVPLGARTIAETHPAFYDMSKEVTHRGTVGSVLTNARGRSLPGAHMLVTTTSGQVDASLGRWGMRGKGAPAVNAGQQVELTGVMKTIRKQEVFVVRTMKVAGTSYVIRNQHGFPVSPQSRERMSQKSGQKGDTL